MNPLPHGLNFPSAAGLDIGELEFMDPDTRAEVLEEAGLDPDDYDFD